MCNPTVASDEKTDSFPLNSKIHSSVQVTVIFGWLNPKFAYPEDKPCIPCPEVVSGLQQRSNIWSSADCWVKSFSYWKKRQWSWDCLRDFSTFTIAPRNSLPSLFHWSHSQSLSISVMIHFSFKRFELVVVGFWDLTSECLLWSWLTYITGHFLVWR